MTRAKSAPRERAWELLSAFVMDSMSDWRRKMVAATGLPFSRVRALRRIAPAPLTLRALAESMGTDAPAATLIVNDLEERGLVRRDPHPEDRRAKLVSLTPEGKRLMRAADAVKDRAPASFDALEAKDVEDLARVLERLRGS